MTAHMPPTPPAGRSTKGPGEPASEHGDQARLKGVGGKPSTKTNSNTNEQGETANVRQNTIGGNHQQDR